MQSEIHDGLKDRQVWLVTGCAGFIGSHLVQFLLENGHLVTGLDNLSCANGQNLDILSQQLGDDAWSRFTFIEGDIRNQADCLRACENADYVLHDAAIGSVPKSFDDPILVDSVNVNGFLNMMTAAATCKVRRFVYASSSAVYGNNEFPANREDQPLFPASPYAVSKYANELYARTLGGHLGLETVGLRYFNIYGSRQDPNGAYAAVIPKWIDAMRKGEDIRIFGDGETYRDFCYVGDVVQANILAATTRNPDAVGNVFNIASGQKISLNDLFAILKDCTGYDGLPVHSPERSGDIRVSCADIDKVKSVLGFVPSLSLSEGLSRIVRDEAA